MKPSAENEHLLLSVLRSMQGSFQFIRISIKDILLLLFCFQYFKQWRAGNRSTDGMNIQCCIADPRHPHIRIPPFAASYCHGLSGISAVQISNKQIHCARNSGGSVCPPTKLRFFGLLQRGTIGAVFYSWRKDPCLDLRVLPRKRAVPAF